MKGSERIKNWPEESREAAQLVIEQYGEPDEVAVSELIWHRPGPWKRIVATRTFYRHDFPVPHVNSVESVIDYGVLPDKVSDLAAFDGSVAVERTAGEVSARCHDEQANFLALNLMHDTVTDAKSVDEARNYYAKEFADYRRKKPTPYMERSILRRRTAVPPIRMCGYFRTESLRKRLRKATGVADEERALRTPCRKGIAAGRL